MDGPEVRESLAPRARPELGQRDPGPPERLVNRLALGYQERWIALERTRGPRERVRRPTHELVDCEERNGANDCAGDGEVVSDDPVLNGVRDQQEYDEIEGVRLPQLPLPTMRRIAIKKR